MRFTIYLFRANASQFESLVRERSRLDQHPYEIVKPRAQLPFKCYALVQRNKPRSPSWLRFLRSHFDLGHLNLRNQSNSFLLLLEASGRLFGITFGYARFAIEQSEVEPDFGLKTTLNSIDPQRLDMMHRRNLDTVTRQHLTHLNQARPIDEFGFDSDLEWVRMISGIPLSASLAKKMAGADSLYLTPEELDLEGLGTLCEKLLTSFQSDSYRSHFPFIDQMRPLKEEDPVIADLEEELRRLLAHREDTHVTVAHPEIPDPHVERYRIYQGHEERYCDELTLREVYAFQEDIDPGSTPDPDKVKIAGVDSEDACLIGPTPLRQYLVAQVQEGSHTYILSLGRWFRIEENYLGQIKAEVAAVPDLTSVLKLPAMFQEEREDAYNERIAGARGWLVLDKKSFRFRSARDKIEACDVLTEDLKLLCVKKMTASATLSHLFSQGSVSARLLKQNGPYRERIKELYQARWPKGFYPTSSKPTIVYAIATDKPGHLAEELFFFSTVSLIQHIRAIRLIDFRVALCKIPIVPAGAGRGAKKA